MAVGAKVGASRWSLEDSVSELAQLADTAGVEVTGRLFQRLSAPSKSHYLGSGKLEELVALKNEVNCDVVIFDDELSPVQQRNLEEVLQVKVIDRAALILDIFARHARTREGKLQVELAQHEYLFPRLAGQWSHLERLGGGIGTRGPGESQLETDRRIVRRKIHRLKAEIEEIRKHRELYRHHRQNSGIPVVALVGYTNAGKSTLLNTLSGNDVLVWDKLFTTLDPTTRRLVLPDKASFLLTDTVGFIQKLPPTIISAFRATLEELTEVNLLVHVVDLTNHNAVEQCQTVEDILSDLDLADKPRITVLNKIDQLFGNGSVLSQQDTTESLCQECGVETKNTVLVSASKGWGLDELLELMGRIIAETSKPIMQI